MDDTNWHMLAVVINANDTVGDVELYVDGAFHAYDSSASTTRSIDTLVNAYLPGINNLVIGGSHNTVNTGADAFKGSTDGVRVYNEALSLTALNQIYTIPEPGTFALTLISGVSLWCLGRRRR